MRRTMLWGIIALFVVGSAESEAQSQQEIERIANTMVRLCVGGGSTSAVSGGGDAGVDLSLRSLDATGKINGEFKISKTSAEGLVEGLNNAIGAVAADQADKVRACLQPVRERLLDAMLPPKKSSQSDNDLAHLQLVATKALGEWLFGLTINEVDEGHNPSKQPIKILTHPGRRFEAALVVANFPLKAEPSGVLRKIYFDASGRVVKLEYSARPMPNQNEFSGRSALCPKLKEKFLRIVSDLSLPVVRDTTGWGKFLYFRYTAMYKNVELFLMDHDEYFGSPSREDCDQRLWFDKTGFEASSSYRSRKV